MKSHWAQGERRTGQPQVPGQKTFAAAALRHARSHRLRSTHRLSEVVWFGTAHVCLLQVGEMILKLFHKSQLLLLGKSLLLKRGLRPFKPCRCLHGAALLPKLPARPPRLPPIFANSSPIAFSLVA